MTGKLFGFTTWVKGVASECRPTHCVIHGRILAIQAVLPQVNVLQDVSKIINHLKLHNLISCLCTQFYRERDTKDICLIHRSEMTFKDRLQVSFWLVRSTPEIKKQLPLTAHFTEWNWSQNLLICVTFVIRWINSTSHFKGEWQLYSTWQVKWMHSKLNLNFEGDKQTLGFLACFKY